MASVMALNSYRYAYAVTKGFTLVELLVVMGVIGVLAAGLIALINPADRIRQANDAKVLADLSQVIKGVQSYVASNGTFPGVAAASNWTSLAGSLSNELIAAPGSVNNYLYTEVCLAGTGCKVAVSLKSNKNTNGNANAVACWVSASGTIAISTGGTAYVPTTTTGVCP